MQISLAMMRVVQTLACLLIVKTTLGIVLAYRDYFPPNFESDFLLGREDHFFGLYQYAFYAHILVGPFTLLSGLILLSSQIRSRLPRLHRYLGKANVICVLSLLAPSGLVMAYWSHGGIAAGIAFVMLALITAASAALGWRAAVQRRFDEHQAWMQRCFLMLFSTVLLRVLGGFTQTLHLGEHYALAAWASWLVPLASYEALRFTRQSTPRRRSSA